MEHKHSWRVVIVKCLIFADAVQLKNIAILSLNMVLLVVKAVSLGDLADRQAEVSIVDRLQIEGNSQLREIECHTKLQKHEICNWYDLFKH